MDSRPESAAAQTQRLPRVDHVPGHPGTTNEVDALAEATAAATAAAQSAGVTMGTASSVEQIEELQAVLDATWAPPEGRSTIPKELLIAMSHAGSYLGTAVRDDKVVGAAVGFFSPPDRQTLHSHVAAVRTGLRSRGVGYALKLHQRAWALTRGSDWMEWTFDPLVARNAYFNIERLGADLINYEANFYGAMEDSLNARSESDRAIMSWHLPVPAGRSPDRPAVQCSIEEAGYLALALTPGGYPSAAPVHGIDHPRVVVQVPPDIELIRRQQPRLDGPWRVALREVLTGLFRGGYQVTGFLREGAYLLEPGGGSTLPAA